MVLMSAVALVGWAYSLEAQLPRISIYTYVGSKGLAVMLGVENHVCLVVVDRSLQLGMCGKVDDAETSFPIGNAIFK